MARHTQNQRALKDGAMLIYQRTDTAKPVWHCRIKFPNHPYVRCSLKTQNEREAVRAAEKLYDELRHRFERGLALFSPTFSEAFDEYLEWLAEQVEDGEAKPKKLTDSRALGKYAREYFEGKRLEQITDSEVERYKEWRISYWTRGPGRNSKTIEYERNGKVVRAPRPKRVRPAKSTLASEDVVLRAVFERGRILGWINRDQIPTIKTERGKGNRRPDFTEPQLQHLLNIAEQRVLEAPNDHVRFMRELLEGFVGLLAFTGMRPFEAMALEWKHVKMFDTDGGKTATKFYVQGKGKERWLVSRDDASAYIFQIAERASNIRWPAGQEADDMRIEGFVFSMPDGTRIKSFRKGLRELLKATNLLTDEHGKTRDAYSLRHYYATQRLLAAVSVYTLAENMGTSVEMIERHYGHVRPELAADELTREKGATRVALQIAGE